MKTVIFRVALLATILISVARAADIPGSCLASFNVKNKNIAIGTSTSSCTALENRRVELFKQINALPASGAIDGADLADRLSQLEKRLLTLEGQGNWVGVGASLSGNFLATLSLAACLGTAGSGCAMAVIGKVLSVVSVIDGAASDSQKAKELAGLRGEIAAIRQKIKSASPPAAKMRDQLVSEFSALCVEVKKSCVND